VLLPFNFHAETVTIENQPSILLTGFEGWDIHNYNPSGSIAQSLNGSFIQDHQILGVVFPVDITVALVQMDKIIENHQPDLIICLGLAPKTNSIQIEKYAYNIYFDPYSDHPLLDMKKIALDGPFIMPATIDVQNTVDSFQVGPIPAEQSYFPGLYLCNAMFYHTLFTIENQELDAPIGFVHIPQISPYEPDGFDIDQLEEIVLQIIDINIPFMI
jgi:pyroglutamyl-peptidase